MARLTINTKASFDIEDVFKALRDTYTPEQLARIAVRMGTTRLNEYDFASVLAKEACRTIMRQYKDNPEIENDNPEYSRAVRLIAEV